jgi:hypothetical protein
MAADDISDLVAKLDREELQQARQLSAEEKIFAGPRLFETEVPKLGDEDFDGNVFICNELPWIA